jgi:hypothetical protein
MGVDTELAEGTKFQPHAEILLKEVVSHEIGHAMGLDHDEDTIMQANVVQGKFVDGTKEGPDPQELYVTFTQANHQLINFYKRLSIEVDRTVEE